MTPNPISGQPDADPISTRRLTWLLSAAVVIVVLFSAALLYARFWQAAPGLWYSANHDRNGHYMRSQNVAFAIRRGDLAGLVREVHAATVWPPLHPLITGAVLAVGGVDYRVAVLPSLAAWVVACWLVFALARRLVPRYKMFAGCVALLFLLGSPAYRAFATDIMLESLGSALTLAVLYLYVSARQEGSAWRGRLCALSFLALFLTKYNYWTLLAAGLTVGTLFEFAAYFRDALRGRLRPAAWLRRLAAQVRHPLTCPLLAACGVTLYVQYAGRLTFTLAGRTATIGRIDIPVEVAYVLLLLRVLPWWRRDGRAAIDRLPPLARQMAVWFAYPLALWFLWPRRLGAFLWSVTYTHHGRVADRSPWLGNLNFYWDCLSHDYHAGLASLVLVLALVALAVLARRRWAPGFTTVFAVLVTAALLTNYHSANRGRFLHSWLAVAWAVAGAGAALTAGTVAARARAAGWSRRPGAFRLAGPGLLAGAVAGLVAVQGSALTEFGYIGEGGPKSEDLSLLALADELRPELERAHRPAVAANESFDLLLDWRLGEDRGPGPRILVPPEALLLPGGERGLSGWLRQHSCDLVLVMDRPDYPLVPGFNPTRVRELLAASGDFTLVAEWTAATADGVSAQLWLSERGSGE